MKVVRCGKLSLVCFHLCKKKWGEKNLTLFILAFTFIKNNSVSLNKELIEQVTSCRDGRNSGDDGGQEGDV